MNLFIDTNVWLSFYHLSSDDLEELKKLAVLLRENKLQLHLPSQVIHEFERNRENKIADALARLRDHRWEVQFPQMCKDYEEYNALRAKMREVERLYSRLLERVTDDVTHRRLGADLLIAKLFSLSNSITCGDDIHRHARERIERGNPPGKEGSLGDAINWEALLESVPDGAELYFITDDKDYSSVLDKERFNAFLLSEWREHKESRLRYYKRLSSFFKEHFPDIRLATELEKDLLIRDLALSGSFAQTHRLVRKLSQHSDFTITQANAILNACVGNTQVSLIIGDADIRQFVTAVIAGRVGELDQACVATVQDLLDPPDLVSEDDDVPF